VNKDSQLDRNDKQNKLTDQEWERRRAIAEKVLDCEIDWIDDVTGYLECPGIEEHTTPNGPRDCRIRVDDVATLFCFHGSCQGQITEANHELRKGINGCAGTAAKPRPKEDSAVTHELIRRQREAEEKEVTRLQAQVGLGSVVRDFATTPEKWLKQSPTRIAEPRDQWRQLLHLFNPDAVTWIGHDVRETDKDSDRFATKFRTAGEWRSLRGPGAPGMYTCPAIFKTGAFSRCNENVLHRPFLVVESDLLTKTEVGAVFAWMTQQCLRLRAIVDTAGKSLHGWFEFPDEPSLKELQIILPAFKCDPALFKPSQPCRLPGALRDGNYQKLLYIDLQDKN
jgi:hypothetical protein